MRRRASRRLLASALGVIVAMALLEGVLRMLPVSEARLMLPVDRFNPVPRLEPGRKFRFSSGWNFSIIARKQTNNYGFLSDLDYSRQQTPLLAVIGDSYVEALQVRNDQALPGLLASAVGDSGRVYGLGASGAALPTYLAYASYAAHEFSPSGLVFVIISNDFDESLLRYQKLPGNHYFIERPDGDLELWRFDYFPTLPKKIARQSALVRYLLLNCHLTLEGILAAFRGGDAYVANTLAKPDPKRLADSRAAVDAFFRLLPQATSLAPDCIAFAVDGIRPSLYSETAMEATQGSYPREMRDYFTDSARAHGYEVIDLQEVFAAEYRKSGERFEFPSDNHWNELGHRVAARAVCRSRLFSRLFPQATACRA